MYHIPLYLSLSLLPFCLFDFMWFLPPLLVFLLVLLTFPPFWILFSFSLICSLLLFHVLIFPILFFFIPSLLPFSCFCLTTCCISFRIYESSSTVSLRYLCVSHRTNEFLSAEYLSYCSEGLLSLSPMVLFFYSSSVSSYLSQTRAVSGAYPGNAVCGVWIHHGQDTTIWAITWELETGGCPCEMTTEVKSHYLLNL